MSITNTQLDTFIAIYKQKFGEELDRQTAYDQASKLIRLVKLTCYERIPKRCTLDMPDTSRTYLQAVECSEG